MRKSRLTLQDLAEAEEWARHIRSLHGANGWLARRWRMDDMSTTGAPPTSVQESSPLGAELENAEPTIQAE